MKKNTNELSTFDINGETTDSSAVVSSDLRPLIHEIRGMQVMLDRDLAELYQVELRVFNQAVRRNLKRFPHNFMFEVDKCEIRQLITNCDWSDKMRYWPQKVMVFTEQGIAMLSAVLRSATAIETSIRIINAFVAMRRTLSSLAPSLATLSARLEANERRQISDQSRNEARFDQIFAKMSEGELPEHQIFYQGKFWDAKSLLIKFIRRAKKELTVIDAYLGVATLDMLAKRGRGVKIELITPSNGDLAETDFEAFGRQCGNLTKSTCGICHDRFIVVDQKELYSIGASLKDAGRLNFAVAKLGETLIPGLLDSLRKATTARVTYGKKAQEQSR